MKNTNSSTLTTSIIQCLLGLTFVIACIYWSFSGSTDNYTTNNWLKGCEEGHEYLGRNGIGVFKDYHCKDKPYTDVTEASMVTLGWNSSYAVYDDGKPVAKIDYDNNFHQYNCAYVWAQEDVQCTLKEFVSNLKKYEDYKNQNKSISNITSKVEKTNATVTRKQQSEVTPKEKTISTPIVKKEQVNNIPKDYAQEQQKDVSQPIITREPDWVLYTQKLAAAIKENWYPMTGTETWPVVLRFTMLKGGTITNIRVISHEGSVYVAEEAIHPLKNISNYRTCPLPPEYKGDSIDIEVRFPSISLVILNN